MAIYAKRQSTTKRITRSDCTLFLEWLRKNPNDGIIIRHAGCEAGLTLDSIQYATRDSDSHLYQFLKGLTVLKTTVETIARDLAQ